MLYNKKISLNDILKEELGDSDYSPSPGFEALIKIKVTKGRNK